MCCFIFFLLYYGHRKGHSKDTINKTMGKIIGKISVYQEKKSGRFVFKTTEHYKEKKKIIRGTSSVNRNEARKAHETNLQKWHDEVDNIYDRINGKETFMQSINEWFKMFRKSKSSLKDRTLYANKICINDLCKAPFATKLVSDITTYDIQEYLNDSSKKYSDSIIKQKYQMLSMYFRAQDLSHNQIDKCIIPKGKSSKEKIAYNDKQISKLYNYVMSIYNHMQPTKDRVIAYAPILLVTLFEYLRYGEVAELMVQRY